MTRFSYMSAALAIGLLGSMVPLQAEWGFTAQPQVCYIAYKESLPNRLKSEETGMLPGIGAQLSLKSDDIKWTSDIQVMSGEMKYDGTTQSGTPVTAQKHNDFTHFETAIYSGVTKLGVGADIWNRDLVDYHEVYSRQYALVGLSLPIHDNNGILAGLDVTATVPFHSNMDLNIVLDNKAMTIAFPLENQIGWKIAVPVSIKTAQNPIVISPYAEWFGFGASEVAQVKINSQTVLNLQEPTSQTFKAGVAISVTF